MSFSRLYPKKEAKKRRINKEISKENGGVSLHHNIKDNLQKLRQEVGNSPDVVIREFEIGSLQVQYAAVFIDNLVDKKLVDDFVMRSLMVDIIQETFKNTVSDKNVFDNALTTGEVKVIKDWNGLMLSILSGDTVILIEGCTEAISGSMRGGESRGIEEPSSQVVIRGPEDGFTESIGTNVTPVRRRIKSPYLWLETMKIGNVTQTDVGIMYIKGIVNDKLV